MARLKVSTLAGGLARDTALGEVAARLARAGFDGVEVPAPPPDRDPAEITREITATGLKIVSVGTMANIPKRDLMSPRHTPEAVRGLFAPSIRLAEVSGA